MIYYVPQLRPVVTGTSGLLARLFGKRGEAEAPPAERLGGVPWGLPSELWPRCAECGGSQSLIAQFRHHAERLSLGGDGRMLFVFQCNHDPGMCETWDQDSGANAAFIVEPDALGQAETTVPADAPPPDPAMLVTGWEAQEDGLTPEQSAAFFSEAGMETLDDDVLDQERHDGTQLLGVPCWIQSPDEAPRGWRFLGQIGSYYLSEDNYLDAHNFGDGGIAYLFAAEAPEGGIPQVKMFWQCG
jgi:hypothetical protein